MTTGNTTKNVTRTVNRLIRLNRKKKRKNYLYVLQEKLR